MPERLVCTLGVSSLLRVIIQRHSVTVLILCVTQIWACNSLISTSSLLYTDTTALSVVAVALSL